MKKLRTNIYKSLPPSLRFKALSIWENWKPAKKYYSQNGEDIIISSIFKNKQNGFYIDIGAHHPKRYSNTHLLYERGWNGINIDANPESITAFKKYRRRDINVLAGVSSNNETLTYHMFSDPAVNTFSAAEAEKWKQRNTISYLGSMQIETKHINNILKEHLDNDVSTDYLNVDIEGLDLQVLQTLDFTTYKPAVISVEEHGVLLDEINQSEIYQLLTANGYVLHSALKFSFIYVLRE
jgi:FkbM family methyltransferase